MVRSSFPEAPKQPEAISLAMKVSTFSDLTQMVVVDEFEFLRNLGEVD
jgi:hypothetical protein